MKRIELLLCALVAMFMLSANSAWAQYVKLTAEDGTVSWIEIEGTINGTNIEISRNAIDQNTKGSIDLNEVWSRSGGRGTNYRVTSIGDNAFYNCRSLTSIVIPSSLTSIGYWAFYGCIGLTSVAIPSSVTSIGYSAFKGCEGLIFIRIPSSVTSIGEDAFFGCSGLISIVVESSNTVYDSRNNCNAIIETASNTLIAGCMNTKIPLSVTSIGVAAFSYCSGLTSIDIPSSVTSIGYGAFVGCKGLTSLHIPNSVTRIEDYTFNNCQGLTSVVIPSSVTSIGQYAFSSCYGLAFIVVESGNSVYDSRNNCNAIIETTSNTLIAGCKNTLIPSSVTSIGDNAFNFCVYLTSIEIPSSVTSIGNFAFGWCGGLTSIEIPSSVTSIGDGAFYDSGLTSIISYVTQVFKTGQDSFQGCENATLYVPAGLVSTYQSTADWNRFSKIEEIPGIALAMSCNNKGKVKINDGIQFTNDMGEVSVYDGVENTFTFLPNDNCKLKQVLIDGLDVTLSVENNQLTTKVHEGSKMIVMFDKMSYDVNGDGAVDISDVVKLVNVILGQ